MHKDGQKTGAKTCQTFHGTKRDLTKDLQGRQQSLEEVPFLRMYMGRQNSGRNRLRHESNFHLNEFRISISFSHDSS